jgi:hypothetical protein
MPLWELACDFDTGCAEIDGRMRSAAPAHARAAGSDPARSAQPEEGEPLDTDARELVFPLSVG